MCNFLPSSISSLESSRMYTANSDLEGGEVWWLDHTIPPSKALRMYRECVASYAALLP